MLGMKEDSVKAQSAGTADIERRWSGLGSLSMQACIERF